MDINKILVKQQKKKILKMIEDYKRNGLITKEYAAKLVKDIEDSEKMNNAK